MASTIKYFSLVLTLFFVHQAVGTSKVYFPLSNETSYPRLEFGALPTMYEYTFCAWVRPHRLNVEYPYIFSYATGRAHNELTVLLQKTTEGSILGYVQMGVPFVNFSCSAAVWKVGIWQHVCASWTGADGTTKFYLSGEQCEPKLPPYISPGSYVQDGGVAMLGQDQDVVGGKFETHQAWYGDITSANLWNEALDDKYIKDLANCAGIWREGNVIAWLKTPMKAYDGVVLTETTLCDANVCPQRKAC